MAAIGRNRTLAMFLIKHENSGSDSRGNARKITGFGKP